MLNIVRNSMLLIIISRTGASPSSYQTSWPVSLVGN